MQRRIPASGRLIVALDVDTAPEAWDIVHSVGDAVSFYKVGLQLFMRSGMTIVDQLVAKGKKVFLDLKVDDTPRTIQQAVRRAAVDGVEFFTLQGNDATARAAHAGRGPRTTPKFLQVTFLSSWDTADFKRHFLLGEDSAITIDEAVLARTRTILAAGCEGVIASGESVGRVRKDFGPDVIVVTPGIRPGGSPPDDHKRSLTPYEAVLSGSDYLVVGRPIRDADDPGAMARTIVEEIEQAWTDKVAKQAPNGGSGSAAQ